MVLFFCLLLNDTDLRCLVLSILMEMLTITVHVLIFILLTLFGVGIIELRHESLLLEGQLHYSAKASRRYAIVLRVA